MSAFISRQAIIMMLEGGTNYCAEKMCSLLKYMADSTVLTPDQITMVNHSDIHGVGGVNLSFLGVHASVQ